MTTNFHLFAGQSLANGTSNETTTDLLGAQTDPLIQRFALNGSLQPLQSPDTDGVTATKPGRSFAEAVGSPIIVNTHAEGGQGYATLKKGSNTYNEVIDALTAGVPSTPVVAKSMHIIHGEADIDKTQSVYQGYLAEWQADYNADIKAITGQSADIPAFICQKTYQGIDTVSLAQVAAARENPAIHLVCPKYTLGTQVHLPNLSYVYLGEYHARAYKTWRDTGSWSPLWPTRVIATRNVVTIDFHVPYGPLVFDTTTVAAQTNQGFQVRDADGTKTITSVELLGTSSVKITLSSELGASPMVRYGANGLGNLRDSDPGVSYHDGTPLRNWCVLFDDPIFAAGKAPPSTTARKAGAL